uniref:Uncharacterized protein n=1 Tax=Theropithecus gelada TaxID=9565 RepID=A0A8D2FNL2_THEGE
MRQPSRTPQRRHILSILHSNRFPTPAHHINIYPQQNRLTKHHTTNTHRPKTNNHLISQPHLTSMHNSLYNKTTPIRPTPMTSQSPCRSSHCRLNSSCRSTPKAGRLWNDTTHFHP